MLFKSELIIKSDNQMSADELDSIIACYTNTLVVFANTFIFDLKRQRSYFHRDEFDEVNDIDIPCVAFELSREVKQQVLAHRFSAFLTAYADLLKSLKLPISIDLKFQE